MSRDAVRARVHGACRLPDLSATHRGLLALAVAGCLWIGIASLPVRAQTPTPSEAAATALPGGDTRSEGEGAGLVGQPVLIAAAVVILGAAAAGITLLYVRVSRED
jgi:hypothetical protein